MWPFGKRKTVEAKSTPLNRLDFATYGRESASGVVVTEMTALQVATVKACVTRISRDVSSMPLGVWRRRRDGSKETADNEKVARLLRSRPNPLHTSHEFVQMVTMQAALRGDGYAYISRGVDGDPVELWPLQKTEVGVQQNGFEPIYTVSAYEGRLSGRYGRESILHLRNGMMNGLTGQDALLYAQNTIGLAAAAQNTQSKAFKNGNRMPGYWQTDNPLKDAELERLAAQLHAAASGDNQYRSPLVDNGVNYRPLGADFRDSQMVETRKHEMIEVCAAFGVLPAILGIDDKTQAFASVEAMFRAHLVHTLRPWLVAWEQTIDRDLLDGVGPLYAKFDTSDMEKATTLERSESYRNLAETFTMMPSELRALEGMPEIPGIDETWKKIMEGRAGLVEEEAGSDEAEQAGDPA